MRESDLVIRWIRGKGPGGQHKNKTENCCVLTHKPTGLTVTADGRHREQNLKNAKRLLKVKIHHQTAAVERHRQNEERRAKIKPGGLSRVRTYDFTSGIVTDHRTGKTSTIKNVVNKGNLDKLR